MKLISNLFRLIARFKKAYRTYRLVHPGYYGLVRLFRLVHFVIWKSGFNGLLLRIKTFEQIRSQLSSSENITKYDILKLKDNKSWSSLDSNFDVGIHIHVFYVDLIDEIFTYIMNIPCEYTLYITSDSSTKLNVVKEKSVNLKKMKAVEYYVAENCGRDIFPFLATVGKKMLSHEFGLHIHTKKSPHNRWQLGGWRRYLLESLLGNQGRISAILAELKNNSALGILFPSYFHHVSQFVFNVDQSNDKAIVDLLRRAGKKASVLQSIDPFFFPAGDMFWFRSKAIAKLVNFNFSPQDFDNEIGQVNGTLAHAIERMFPYFAQEQGLIARAFLAQSFLSEICSAHEIELLTKYVSNGIISKAKILFDHDIGGGTNKFSRQLVDESLRKNEQVIRVYFSESRWFIQWISENDGMLFYTDSLNELFKIIALTQPKEIIVNSIYGYPGIAAVIDHIIILKETLNATVDIKVHDFYSVCSSPHLADFTRKYCGVPENHKICKVCLSKNKDWYHSWYPRNEIPTNIDSWRKPFKSLLQKSDSITFFNESSVEIIKKAFDLDDSKIRVVPHNTDYIKIFKPIKAFGDLHFGLLGTLSHIKGGYIIESLYQHIVAEKLNIPISVIGSSVVDISKGIEVAGNYEITDLPRLIEKKGINVVLMPSIVPETFSYTISEAMAFNLPIVCFDLGAQADRVKNYNLGAVIPLNASPAAIISAAKKVLKKAKDMGESI